MTSTELHIVVERSHFVRAQQQRSIEALSLPRLRCRVLRRRTVVAPSASSSSSSAASASAAARPRRPSQSSEAARAGRGPTPRGAQTRGPRRPWARRRPWTTGRGRCPSSVADASPKDELSDSRTNRSRRLGLGRSGSAAAFTRSAGSRSSPRPSCASGASARAPRKRQRFPRRRAARREDSGVGAEPAPVRPPLPPEARVLEAVYARRAPQAAQTLARALSRAPNRGRRATEALR